MPSVSSRPEPGPAGWLAPAALVALAALSPWAMGAVTLPARHALAGIALLAAALSLLLGAARGAVPLPALPSWPLAGFLALALVQLLPLPGALHLRLAPGSHAVWHPGDPDVALVLGAFARPISVDPATTLAALALTAGLALLAWLSAPALARPRAALVAIASLAVCGFALSAYAIWARARFGSLLYGQIAVPTVAPFGPFVSKNHFAGWTVMAALLTAGLALGVAGEARRRGRDWTTESRAGGVILAIVAALVMALAALASLSRGGALALLAGAACLLTLRVGAARRHGAVLATLLPTLVLGAVLVGLVPREAHGRLGSLGGASFRLDTWKDTLRLAATSPLVGHGLGAFHDAYPRFKRAHGILRVEHAENDYLETLAETGVLGLGIVLGGALLLVSGGVRRNQQAAGGALDGIRQGAVAALAALSVHSLVDFNLRIPSNAALAALVAATAAAAGRPRSLSRPLAAGLGVVLLALAAAGARPAERPALSARAELQAAASASLPSIRRLRLERARDELGRALRARPADAEAWLMLAFTHQALGRPATAAAFARHARWLDPQRPGLIEAAGRITGAP